MRLLEFQAKELLKEKGVPVPEAELAVCLEDLENMLFPKILKAQTPVGGRGKAGAIRRVESLDEAKAQMEEILNLKVKGYPVAALLCESPAKIERELYLAFVLDKQSRKPMIMACSSGGVEIEEIARNNPAAIVKKYFDPNNVFPEYSVRSLAKALQIDDVKSLGRLIRGMISLYDEVDATLVEINPLATTDMGLMALDAKVVLDEKAAFLHGSLFDELSEQQKLLDQKIKSPTVVLAEERGLNYAPLGGDLGLIADGAGTGMLTMDMIVDAGGKPANFCEMGGLSNAEVMENAMEVLLSDHNLKVLLISLIGGMTRMDHMAEGIVRYYDHNELKIPLVVRMCGTKAEVGVPMLEDRGIPVFADLDIAVKTAVDYVRRGGNGHFD
jgi:succinyl-CoA synthetase beta subunit